MSFKIKSTLLVLILMAPWTVHSQFGLGVVIGDPTGLTGKYFFNSREAVDISIGWSDSRIHLVSSYLWHGKNQIQLDNVNIDYYLGIGGKLRERSNTVGPPSNRYEESEMQLGIRFPIGLKYLFSDPSIEVFAELAPTLNLSPSTDFDIAGGIGARYFF